MKSFLLSFLIFFTLNAAQSTKQTVTIGLGAYMQTQPYKNISSIKVPSPVIFFDNSIFYIRWSRFGVYFLGKKEQDFSWGFSLTAQPRTYGYTPNNSSTLKGMHERKTSFEGGLAFSASYHKQHIESMLLTDILGRHDTWIFKTELGSTYHLNRFSFYPSFIVIYQSQKFLNYYYGVKHSEEIDNIRPAYTPNDGILIGAQTYIKYPLTKKLSTLINVRADLIPKTAYNSPIVNNRFIYCGLLSLIYKFEY